jgi:CRP-like cAMP-binding protein
MQGILQSESGAGIVAGMAPAEAQQFFADDPWFSGLAPGFRTALVDGAIWQTLMSGEALSHGGDTSGGILGLAEGIANVQPAVGPPDAGIIHLFRAPIWFGLMPLSQGRPRAVSMVAQTQCRVARVPQSRVAAILAGNPAWWQHMYDLALTHFLVATQTAADLHIADSRRRLCAVLLRVANPGEKGGKPVVVASQQELATMSNMSRQTARQVLGGLVDDGLITLTYRGVTLNAPDRLRWIVEA